MTTRRAPFRETAAGASSSGSPRGKYVVYGYHAKYRDAFIPNATQRDSDNFATFTPMSTDMTLFGLQCDIGCAKRQRNITITFPSDNALSSTPGTDARPVFTNRAAS